VVGIFPQLLSYILGFTRLKGQRSRGHPERSRRSTDTQIFTFYGKLAACVTYCFFSLHEPAEKYQQKSCSISGEQEALGYSLSVSLVFTLWPSRSWIEWAAAAVTRSLADSVIKTAPCVNTFVQPPTVDTKQRLPHDQAAVVTLAWWIIQTSFVFTMSDRVVSNSAVRRRPVDVKTSDKWPLSYCVLTWLTDC